MSAPDASPKIYGVIVSKSSLSMFHDVEVNAVMHQKRVPSPNTLTVLPQ